MKIQILTQLLNSKLTRVFRNFIPIQKKNQSVDSSFDVALTRPTLKNPLACFNADINI